MKGRHYVRVLPVRNTDYIGDLDLDLDLDLVNENTLFGDLDFFVVEVNFLSGSVLEEFNLDRIELFGGESIVLDFDFAGNTFSSSSSSSLIALK